MAISWYTALNNCITIHIAISVYCLSRCMYLSCELINAIVILLEMWSNLIGVDAIFVNNQGSPCTYSQVNLYPGQNRYTVDLKG